MSIAAKNINPTDVKVKLLTKGISRAILIKKLKVGASAISMALKGDRMQLLHKINEIADNYKPIKRRVR